MYTISSETKLENMSNNVIKVLLHLQLRLKFKIFWRKVKEHIAKRVSKIQGSLMFRNSFNFILSL